MDTSGTGNGALCCSKNAKANERVRGHWKLGDSFDLGHGQGEQRVGDELISTGEPARPVGKAGAVGVRDNNRNTISA